MSPGKPTISIDGEWLLAKFQKIEYILDEIRAACGDGTVVTKIELDKRKFRPRDKDGTPVTRSPQAGAVDISEIEWLIKGSDPARDDDKWAWAFAYHQDGEVKDEAHAIVTALLHEDKVTVGQYEVKWGGRDKDLLSRTIPKSKGRKSR